MTVLGSFLVLYLVLIAGQLVCPLVMSYLHSFEVAAVVLD